MSMEDLWPRQSVHGWVLFLGIKSVYSDKSERIYRGKCLGWPVTSYGGDPTSCTLKNTANKTVQQLHLTRHFKLSPNYPISATVMP